MLSEHPERQERQKNKHSPYFSPRRTFSNKNPTLAHRCWDKPDHQIDSWEARYDPGLRPSKTIRAPQTFPIMPARIPSRPYDVPWGTVRTALFHDKSSVGVVVSACLRTVECGLIIIGYFNCAQIERKEVGAQACLSFMDPTGFFACECYSSMGFVQETAAGEVLSRSATWAHAQIHQNCLQSPQFSAAST